MERWHYAYAGLRVVSELPIPEWAGFEQPRSSAPADVSISLDDALKEEPDSGENLPLIRTDEFRFHAPEVGYYRVREGREIVVSPTPGAGWRRGAPLFARLSLGRAVLPAGHACSPCQCSAGGKRGGRLLRSPGDGQVHHGGLADRPRVRPGER